MNAIFSQTDEDRRILKRGERRFRSTHQNFRSETVEGPAECNMSAGPFYFDIHAGKNFEDSIVENDLKNRIKAVD